MNTLVVKTWSGNVRNKSPFIVSIGGRKMFGVAKVGRLNESVLKTSIWPQQIVGGVVDRCYRYLYVGQEVTC